MHMLDSRLAPTHPRSDIRSVIREASNGRMFILVDDDERSFGSLVIPAQMATPAAVNFMATHARGLVCLALTRKRVDELGLPLMGKRPEALDKERYTVSIEAKNGVSTGISAADRSQTIMAAIGFSGEQAGIVSPGHVFPIVAQSGGVLMRAGHAEAAVDIARLAGLNPSAVLCRMLGPSGAPATMAEMLVAAKEHGLTIGAVRDLIDFRRRHDNLVERCSDEAFTMPGGTSWRALTYRNREDDTQQIALVKGRVDGETPTLVRMHAMSLFADVLGCVGPRRDLLNRSIAAIEEAGQGVIVLMNQQNFGLPLVSEREQAAANNADLRAYGFGAQILSDLNIHAITMLTQSLVNVVAIEGWGISIAEQRLI